MSTGKTSESTAVDSLDLLFRRLRRVDFATARKIFIDLHKEFSSKGLETTAEFDERSDLIYKVLQERTGWTHDEFIAEVLHKLDLHTEHRIHQ